MADSNRPLNEQYLDPATQAQLDAIKQQAPQTPPTKPGLFDAESWSPKFDPSKLPNVGGFAQSLVDPPPEAPSKWQAGQGGIPQGQEAQLRQLAGGDAPLAPPTAQDHLDNSRPTQEDIPTLYDNFRKALAKRAAGDVDGYNNILNEMNHIRAPKLNDIPELQFDGKTAKDISERAYKESQVLGQRYEAEYQKVFGPEGQMKTYQQATDDAHKMFTRSYTLAQYGSDPETVAKWQDLAQKGTAEQKAEANRQLTQMQEKAQDPGDPARLWNNMDTFHQAKFLMGNSMSQLGMALMKIQGTTPMDQLNHMMDLDYRQQKDKYERRQTAVKNAYDAYSHAASMTKDMLERELLAKNMMSSAFEIHAQGAGLAEHAQQFSDARNERQNQLAMSRFKNTVEAKTAQLTANFTQISLQAKMSEMNQESIPPAEIDKITAGIKSATILLDQSDELSKGNSSFAGTYSHSMPAAADEVVANIEKRGGKEDPKHQRDLMDVGYGEMGTKAARGRMRDQATRELAASEATLAAYEGNRRFARMAKALRTQIEEARTRLGDSGAGGDTGQGDTQLK